jgi:hypothetical protein
VPTGAGQIVDEDDLNGFGRIATYNATFNSGAINTVETVVDTVVWPSIAGRTYRLEAYIPWSLSVANDEFLIRMREGSTTAGGQYQYSSVRQASTGVFSVYLMTEWTEVTTGNRSFSITAQRQSGTGNIVLRGAVSQPRIITVDRVI